TLSSHYLPHPPSTLFPYTTLFRSSGNHADIHFDCFCVSYLLKLTFLQKAKKFRLKARRNFPDFVQENSPSISDLQTSDFIFNGRSEEHTSELQSLRHLVCRLLLEK